MTKQGYLALDLGAESGRAMLATLDGGKVELAELHRFRHLPQKLPSGLHWNLLELWSNLLEGVAATAGVTGGAASSKVELVSLGCDTWGVDYALLGKSGQVLGLPYCYRDDRHFAAYDQVLAKFGREMIYDATGIQFMPLNTLYQLYAQKKDEPGLLDLATRLVMIPDLLHYWFTGQITNEATDVSTTQMVNPHDGRWATGLLDQIGIPTHFLGETCPAGTVVGKLRGKLVEDLAAPSLAGLRVIAPGTHDTASAVAAVPVDEKTAGNWAYLSSGTWSLMGAEIDTPVINDKSCALSFTHERGVGGDIRFLKNIAGLWLVQECRRDFEKRGDAFDYAQLTALAAKAKPLRTLVNPDHPPFAKPDDMPAKIAAFAEQTGQPAPQSPGEFVRCCLESLALAYRRTLNMLAELLDKKFDVLHVVGGGGRNELLNQMTADACGVAVIVGPYEATAIGNALVQAMGAGAVKDLAELRAIVRNSFELKTYEPTAGGAYDEEYSRFQSLLSV